MSNDRITQAIKGRSRRGRGDDAFANYRKGVDTGVMKSATPNVVRHLLDEIDRLQAIVAALRKCNRLVDGKLVCDCPVVPGMTVWYYGDMGLLRSGKAVTFVEDTLESIWVGEWVRLDECFDTQEAAQAAGGE